MLLPFEKEKRKIITKIFDAVTDEKYGKRPEKRTTKELLDTGIVIIDKPQGPTSHQVVAYVKNILKIEKAGHSGTLDPHVSGVLPVALGRATRVLNALLSAGKEYVCLMHLHKDISLTKLREAFVLFTGRIKQLPPVRSSVRRKERFRRVYYIELIEKNDKDILFRVGTQAGTYIRKLVHDIGEYLRIGAHMVELRRTKAGPFNEEQTISLNDLRDDKYYFDKENKEITHIFPMEYGISHLPKIWVLDSAVNPLSHGTSLKIPGIVKFESPIKKGDMVAVLTLKGELITIGESLLNCKDIKKLTTGVAVKPKQVIMPSNLYPKIKK